MIPKSTKELHEGIFLEHLEEISVIYDTWLLRMRDPGFNGFGLMDTERRMEGHLDALTENVECSAICMTQALDGDVGECYGAVRVLLRQSRHELLTDLICQINPDDVKRMQGVVDAICHEPARLLPDEFLDRLMPMDECRIRIIARVAACHRYDCAKTLYDALKIFEKEKDVLIDILHALGSLHPSYGVDRLFDFIKHGDKDIVHKTLETLLKIGDKKELASYLKCKKPHEWPPRLLGFYGDRDMIREALFAMDDGDLTSDHMIAAGLTGDVTLFPNFMAWLVKPHLSGHAAMALHLITGLTFYEDYFVPDITCEEDLFDDEKEAWKNGTLYPNGSVPGQTIVRLSRDPNIWATGIRNSGIHFDPEKRYRVGSPLSPLCVFEVIKSNIFPDSLRQLCCEEMAVLYGIDIPFDIRMPGSMQRTVLDSYGEMIHGKSSAYIEGVPYYQGHLVKKDLEPDGKSVCPN